MMLIRGDTCKNLGGRILIGVFFFSGKLNKAEILKISGYKKCFPPRHHISLPYPLPVAASVIFPACFFFFF